MSELPYILDGLRIKAIRERLGMSSSDLAEALGMARSSRAAITAIEAGRNRPTKATAEKIAAALGVSLDEITRQGVPVTTWVAGRRAGGGSDARPLDQRLMEKIRVDDNGCWIWQGRINQAGYGEIKIPGRRLKAHRAVYEQRVGPIPHGLELDHLCQVPPCVNPQHLEPVTRNENARRVHARAAERRLAAA